MTKSLFQLYLLKNSQKERSEDGGTPSLILRKICNLFKFIGYYSLKGGDKTEK